MFKDIYLQLLSAMGLVNDLLWGKVLIVVLVGLGLYFTLRSKFVQLRYFGDMFRIFGEAFKRQPGQLSSFQALMLSVAGRVGAGNIAGVAVAITLGGPGAVFWMWLVALLGMATSYFECTLGQLYKQRQPDGTYRGGPAFYIEHGLGKHGMAVLFSVLLLVTFGFGFNALQSYTVAVSLHDTFNIPTYGSGLILVAVIGLIIFGGIQRIAGMADVLVPIMGISYVGMALVILGMNIEVVPETLMLIVRSAFGLEPAFAGGMGAALVWGVKRGLFSNEAGLGSAPNVAAVAEVKHPAAQGIVQSLSVFIDTFLVCTSTALIILLSGIYQPGAEVEGIVLTQNAMASQVGEWGKIFVSMALVLFAFTTLVYNYYLGENALSFFSRNRTLLILYRVLVITLIMWGSLQDLTTVFGFADLTMGLLALVNLTAVTLLFKKALRVMDDYDAQIKAGVKSPVFDANKFQDLKLDNKAWPVQAAASDENLAALHSSAHQR